MIKMPEARLAVACALLVAALSTSACGDPVGSWKGTYKEAVYANRFPGDYPIEADFCSSGDVHVRLLRKSADGQRTAVARQYRWRWFDGDEGIETESDPNWYGANRYGGPQYTGVWDLHGGTLEFEISNAIYRLRFPAFYSGSMERTDSDPEDCP